jgi:glycosyltransferase involved in cell wall biosynthesis
LRAYIAAFTAKDDVCLQIHTYLFGDYDNRNVHDVMMSVIVDSCPAHCLFCHQPKKVSDRIDSYLREINATTDLPCINVMTQLLRKQDMPRLYKACDAFVLPSRGEGWGTLAFKKMTAAKT